MKAHGLIYNVTSIEVMAFNDTLRKSGQAVNLSQLVGQGDKLVNSTNSFEKFVRDLFHRLYAEVEELVPGQPSRELGWAVRLHNTLDRSNEFSEFRLKTEGDATLATTAALLITERVIDEMRSRISKINADASRLAELRNQVYTLRNEIYQMVLDQMKQALQEVQDEEIEVPEVSPKDLDELAKLVTTRDKADVMTFMEERWGGLSNDEKILAALERSLQEAEQTKLLVEKLIAEGVDLAAEADAFADLIQQKICPGLSGYLMNDLEDELDQIMFEVRPLLTGGFGTGRVGVINPAVIAAYRGAILANPDRKQFLNQVLEIVGRMMPVAKQIQASKNVKPEDVKAGISFGQSLSNAVNLAGALANPIEFVEKYTNNEIMEWGLESDPYSQTEDSSGKGPIILCVDISESTEDYNVCVWEQAIAYIMGEVAFDQGRTFGLIHFMGRNTSKRNYKNILKDTGSVTSYEEFEATSDPLKREEYQARLLRSVLKAPAGGTDFEGPLNKALALIETVGFQNADVILATDGDAYIDEAWTKAFLERKAALNFKVHTILLGSQSDTVKAFSDNIVRLNTHEILANDPEKLEGIFGI